jgi:hypothetical protein
MPRMMPDDNSKYPLTSHSSTVAPWCPPPLLEHLARLQIQHYHSPEQSIRMQAITANTMALVRALLLELVLQGALATTPALGNLANETPDTAVAIPLQAATGTPTCTQAYNAVIPQGTAYEAAGLLAPCGPSRGGFYYSFGPFASAGTVTISTTGDNTCLNGGDTVVSLYDNTDLAAPACIYNNDDIDTDGRNYCSLLHYSVTAADVASGRKFLLKVGLWADDRMSVYIGQDITLSVSFACARLPNEYSSAAVIIPPTCSLAYTTSIPSGTPYQTTTVLQRPCGTLFSKGGFYYTIGPFTAAGTLNLVTAGANNCWSGSDTLIALYDNTAAPVAPYCISYNDDFTGYCSFYRFQLTQAHVNQGRKFIIRVGLYNDVRFPAVFNQTITFNASYTCTSSPVRTAQTTRGPPAKLAPIPAMLPSPTPKLNRTVTKP